MILMGIMNEKTSELSKKSLSHQKWTKIFAFIGLGANIGLLILFFIGLQYLKIYFLGYYTPIIWGIVGACLFIILYYLFEKKNSLHWALNLVIASIPNLLIIAS